MKISSRANKIQPSLTRALFDKAKNYTDVIDFTLGDPDYQTPENIKYAACKAINEGNTKYSENAGLMELRQTIADRIMLESNVKFEADGEIMVTVGAMEALYLALSCMLDDGDEVIIPAPYWINYEHMTEICGGVPVVLDSDYDNDFIVDTEKIIDAITDKTVAIIINSPDNPTGSVYDYDMVKNLCEIAVEKNIVLIWDECYKHIVYDNSKVTSVLDFPEAKDNIVVINSCSKTFSMTGWRIGYIAGPRELIAAATKVQENIAACASLPSQYAAIEAFKSDDSIIQGMVNGFKERRNVLVDGISSIDKLSCRLPKATFYALVDIRGTGMKSEEFAYALLDAKQVAVVPGITYGECCEGFIRIAYTMDIEKIKIGVQRIKEFVESL